MLSLFYISSATPPMRQREEKQRLALFGKDVWELQKCMNLCQDSKGMYVNLYDRHVSMTDWPVRRKDLSISSVVYRILPEIYVFGTSYLDVFRFWPLTRTHNACANSTLAGATACTPNACVPLPWRAGLYI